MNASVPQHHGTWAVSLLGGPFHNAATRMRLVRGSNTIWGGLTIGLLLWFALLALALLTGVAERILVLSLIAAHVRLLVVLPLLFVFETWLDRQVGTFVWSIVDSGVVPPSEQPTLQSVVDRLTRWRSSWLPDLFCLMAAMSFWAMAARFPRFGSTAATDPATVTLQQTLVAAFYFAVCMTVFRFLVFRLAWRLFLWWWLLWRISRLKLQLVAAHPDRAGGLGDLEVVQFQFLPLVAAISALVSATYAEELARGSATFAVVYPATAAVAILSILMVFAPLLVFTPDLVQCRERGFATYMAFASRYVESFEKKWVSSPSGEDPLGTADLQSLADLGNSVNVVREMRFLPVSPRLLFQVAAAAIAPMLPLLLFQYSATSLVESLLKRLIGG